MLAEHQTVALRGGNFQGGGDHLGTLGPGGVSGRSGVPSGRSGAVSDPAVDRDHADIFDDRAREHAPLPFGGLQLGGQNHIHAIPRIDEPGVARRRPDPDRHRTGSGPEHRGEKPSLPRSDNR